MIMNNYYDCLAVFIIHLGLISPSTTTFSIEYPVWILGKCYNLNPDMEGIYFLNHIHLRTIIEV